MFLDSVIPLHIGSQIFLKQCKLLLVDLERILKFHSLDLNQQNWCKKWALISSKLELDLDGKKEHLNSWTSLNIKWNQAIFLQLRDLMVLIKLFNMVLDLMPAIRLCCWKLMEFWMLFKVKMLGIGQSIKFKEMIGKLGKNGPWTQDLMLLFFLWLSNQELSLM